MNTKLLTCPKCGIVDSFYTEQKANNNVAKCARCNAFIKNIPYEQPKLYVGKYKGTLISAIDDLNYLQWAVKNMRLSVSIKNAIEKQISLLEHLAR